MFRVSVLLAAVSPIARGTISDVRPPMWERRFVSQLVDAVVDAGQAQLAVGSPELSQLLGNCYPNTLDTTVLFSGLRESGDWRGKREIWDTFVITGDIPAMWLRDSANQVLPYMPVLRAALAANRTDEAFTSERDLLVNFFFGVLHRHAVSMNIDPYAQAFSWFGAEGLPSSWKSSTHDTSAPSFGGGAKNAFDDARVFERNLEVDSLCSVLRLATEVITTTNDYERALRDPDFVLALVKAMSVLEDQQKCNSTKYKFRSQSWEPTDSRSHGVGFPCRDTGMVRTPFRPSDDSTIFDFNIPVNAMLADSLGRFLPVADRLTELLAKSPAAYPQSARGLVGLRERMQALKYAVEAGIRDHGTMSFHGEKVYAYEVDGFGNAHFMDDANVPSLLSLPFLGFAEESDPLYQATRSAVLGPNNPWYFNGTAAAGVGSPHTGRDRIWPMSLVMEALTSRDTHRIKALLSQLTESTRSNNLMHESFDKDDVSSLTRPWFAWANTLFGELLLKVMADPELCAAVECNSALDIEAVIHDWAPAIVLV